MHGGDIYRNKVEHDFSVNTNFVKCPDYILNAIMEASKYVDIYPDIICDDARNNIAKLHRISIENVLCTSGASEGFMAIAHALRPKKAIVIYPTFSGYEYVCDAIDCEIVPIFLKEEKGFSMDESVFEEIENLPEDTIKDVGMLFIANPNNPTGKMVDSGLLFKLQAFCEKNGICIVVDESFLDFTEYKKQSWLANACLASNVIVVRSLTKIYSIPGVRVGYITASKELIKRIKKQLPEWNISIISQYVSVVAAYFETRQEEDFINYQRETVEKVKENRDYLVGEIKKCGIKVYDSDANFIIVNSTIDLYQKLLEEGILIRNLEDEKGLGKGYYRIAVKDKESCELLAHKLVDIVLMSL